MISRDSSWTVSESLRLLSKGTSQIREPTPRSRLEQDWKLFSRLLRIGEERKREYRKQNIEYRINEKRNDLHRSGVHTEER
jgi:hypothetical protein